MSKKYRKPAIISAFNVVSGLIHGKNPIDAGKLIAAAKKRTGQNSLGDDFAEEAMVRMVQAANKEARLHDFGKFMIREKIRTQLENRLWAEHWIHKYPEILEQQVHPILAVTGLQRTGTTKMQRLLSLQDGARALYSWEALYPAPLRKPDEAASRKRLTRRNEKAVRFISPVFHAIHPIHTNQPEEDVLLMDLNFLSTSAEAIMNVPSFAAWLNEQDPAQAYRFEAKMLKLLQWQRAARYWILKSPHHLEFLEEMSQTLPVKGFIWMHRELEKCVPSFMSMLYYSRAMFSDDVREAEIIAQWIPKTGKMLTSGLNYRRHAPGHIHDVRFGDLMSDAGDVLGQLSGKFPGTIPAEPQVPAEEYRSRHTYSAADWQIDAAVWTQAFSHYEKEYHDKKRQV